ncbi:fimbrial protein [Erwinia billingiae]|uniref:fimbrial protein n=1 Tax=Erwinia billingiae TaxID=182337 RepID=UPI001243C971|nr:fimbrial protein [Erwinia billingiae]QEW32612.1 type 1 fimbrial protein [Erwinia billingiae]
MKLNKIVLALGMGAVLISGAVNAADDAVVKDQGHGTVNFSGSIVDSPCSISSNSDGQEVNLGEISSKALENNGTSTPKNFDIELDNCALTTQKGVTVTFSGAAGATNKDHLGITGTASGASIAITDGSGTPIALNTPSASQTIQNGTNHLLFSAYLQGDGASAPTPGDFASVADFTLAYQ